MPSRKFTLPEVTAPEAVLPAVVLPDVAAPEAARPAGALPGQGRAGGGDPPVTRRGDAHRHGGDTARHHGAADGRQAAGRRAGRSRAADTGRARTYAFRRS